MSTKRTIDYEHSSRELKGKKPLKPKTSVPFHLYTDVHDDLDKANGTVYLEMQGVLFRHEGQRNRRHPARRVEPHRGRWPRKGPQGLRPDFPEQKKPRRSK